MSRPRDCPLCYASFAKDPSGGNFWEASPPEGTICDYIDMYHVVHEDNMGAPDWNTGRTLIRKLRSTIKNIEDMIAEVEEWGRDE